jgi:hypothetical protein
MVKLPPAQLPVVRDHRSTAIVEERPVVRDHRIHTTHTPPRYESTFTPGGRTASSYRHALGGFGPPAQQLNPTEQAILSRIQDPGKRAMAELQMLMSHMQNQQPQFPMGNDPGFIPPGIGGGFGDPGFMPPGIGGGFGDPGFIPSNPGIAPGQFYPGNYGGSWDASAADQCAKLAQQPGQISGRQMLQAIINGISDKDGNATSSELNTFKQFAQDFGSKMSPQANEMLQIYERSAMTAQSRGENGLSDREMRQMATEMRSALHNYLPY